jgi:5'-methylthioadenosine phosphorylase
MKKRVGVIGGSGLYKMEGFEIKDSIQVETPFGDPSDRYMIVEVDDVELVFLPRHGIGHRWMPSQVNFRANIYGMKSIGVRWIIAVSAVGSMKQEYSPGQILIPDQFIDRTKDRPHTFFTDGIVGHVQFADPVCPVLSQILYEAGRSEGVRIKKGGVYLCIEGPQFSTRAESHLYRQWGVDIIGMTNIPEAKLAREAEICYATLALCTDYDCWYRREEDVRIDAVLKVIEQNVNNAQRIILRAAKSIGDQRNCICATALKDAILTDPQYIPEEKKKQLEIIIGRYIS